jgi:hypothetical protein
VFPPPIPTADNPRFPDLRALSGCQFWIIDFCRRHFDNLTSGNTCQAVALLRPVSIATTTGESNESNTLLDAGASSEPLPEGLLVLEYIVTCAVRDELLLSRYARLDQASRSNRIRFRSVRRPTAANPASGVWQRT